MPILSADTLVSLPVSEAEDSLGNFAIRTTVTLGSLCLALVCVLHGVCV